MINRRKFLQNTGALALGGFAITQSAMSSPMPDNRVPSSALGLQLYTVTKEIESDLDGTLQRIAEIGYTNLETASSRKGGFYGITSKEFAAKVKGYGLFWRAHHIGGAPFRMPAGATPPAGAVGKPVTMPKMLNLRENYQEAVDLAAEGGIKYLVCSSTPINSLEEIKLSIETFNKTGEACQKAGIGFAFHNHWKEFERVEGKVPYDLFLSETSADLVKFELDLGWATKSGTDPVELFKKHPGRFPLWHIKDLSGITQQPVEIGTGYVNLKRVFDAAETAGMRYAFVEQDAAPKPLENIANSFANLKAMLGNK